MNLKARLFGGPKVRGMSLCLLAGFAFSALASGPRLFVSIPLKAATGELTQDSRTTVWNGVYTEAQASRGQQAYQRTCSYCHLKDLSGFGGDTTAPPLTGARFFVRWDQLTVAEIFTTVQETMPDNAPSSLSSQEYVDIIGYLFKANDMPSGTTELSTDREKLERILITKKP
jgi:cytochrome c